MQEDEDSSGKGLAATHNIGTSPDLPKILHALANKLLPIIAFSDLGIRSSQDPILRNYFEKIGRAAGDARDLIVSVRRDFQEREHGISVNAQESGGGNVRPRSEDENSII